ncbi:dipeptidase [Bradyrhizobium sp.]|uniref:dipeptidase n=1 Tax=Bradyrhizobium sp. TaxID=376 RepID=UPI0025BC9C08|nr:membrane dipeptidase [Bradyrhizobium sp.]MBV8918064.1 membrane dipeptidase [Bradyrhizobium sp.]
MSNKQAAPSPILLDAAAPLMEPRFLAKRLPDVVAGGVDALLATVGAIEDFRATMEILGAWLEIERLRKQPIRIARSVAEIRAAKTTGETAIVVHFQGSDPIEDELDFLNAFQACGLRVMQLTYNTRNRVGDGCFEPSDIGLSKFGRKVVQRMEDLRIVVDLSHAGNRTALEATEVASRPLVVTHANARALLDTPRNATDEVIRAVAASGGVVGVCAAPFFLAQDKPATLDMLVDHAAYIAELVGAQHVGLGFDFADEDEEDFVYFGYDERYIPRPPWNWPTGIAGHADAGNVAHALRKRGFSESETVGILGENFLRVFSEIWGG